METSRYDALIETLRTRFEKNTNRHPALKWAAVLARLEANPGTLRSLDQMEATGGEPDVIIFNAGEYLFCDCSAESPAGRRSLCYDREALSERKEAKPVHSAVGMAEEMGIELLDEIQYRALQALGEFDLKTSSWLKTPANIRTLGGALFGDRRYDTVFVYHNGAQSYYGVRGFRGCVRV